MRLTEGLTNSVFGRRRTSSGVVEVLDFAHNHLCCKGIRRHSQAECCGFESRFPLQRIKDLHDRPTRWPCLGDNILADGM